MTKIRPCKKGCGYPALKGRQFCKWHALMRLSSDEQAASAVARRALADSQVARVPKSDWPDGERWCAGCQSFVPLFYTSGSRCKACTSVASHSRRVQDNYGITAEEYDRILRRQGGRCAICGNKPRTIRFAVDHDHKTGEVRGILCKRCNHDLLGGGHDSIDVLWRALVYLIHPPAQRADQWAPPPSLTLQILESHLEKREVRRIEAELIRRQQEAEPPPF